MGPRLSDVLLRTQTDERLAALAEHGHERAFGVLVERYRSQLVRAAGRLVGTERAEDVVQQTLLRAWSAIQAGTSVSHVSGWLYQILRNTALTEHAHSRVHEQLPADLADRHSCAAEAESRLTLAAVLGEMQRLPEHQRSALVQTEFAGRSRREVATELGVSEGAVRQLVHRARNTLRLSVTAITPFPLAAWATRPHASSPLAHRVAELGGQSAVGASGTPAAAGGALLGGGAVLKAGAVVLAAGALGGGLVIKALGPPKVHDRNVPSVLSRRQAHGAASRSVALLPPTLGLGPQVDRTGGKIKVGLASRPSLPLTGSRSTASSDGRHGASGGDPGAGPSSETSSTSADSQATERSDTTATDSQSSSTSADGSTSRASADGSTSRASADGSTSRASADGSTSRASADGSTSGTSSPAAPTLEGP